MSNDLAVLGDVSGVAAAENARSTLQIFSTCPSSLTHPDHYVEQVTAVARWSEQAGCAGILVYTDNSIVDSWQVAQIIIRATHSLSPLVAVQPVYMHPYSVAKIVSSLAFLYGRRVYLNMVAGGFKNDLIALNDQTPHDARYARLVEYTTIIQRLTEGKPVSYEGQFYTVKGLSLNPKVPAELRPGVLVSGSSPAGLEAAQEMGALAVRYPEPPDRKEAQLTPEMGPCGLRVGIVTRPTEQHAWTVAIDRFPEDRQGQLTRQLATKVSDSAWHKSLHGIGQENQDVADNQPGRDRPDTEIAEASPRQRLAIILAVVDPHG